LDQKRITFRLYASKQVFTELGVQCLIQYSRKLAGLQHALVGGERLINDKGALILEVTVIEAAQSLKDLMEEGIVISPTEMLINTTASQAEWERRLTQLWHDDPALSGMQVKWRRGTHQGRPWAKPHMLDDIVRAVAKRAMAGDQQHHVGEGQIILQGPLGSKPVQLMTKLMEAVVAKTQLPMIQQMDGKRLRDYGWRMQMGTDGRPTGRVDVKMQTVEQLEKIGKMLRQDVVEVNGNFLPIEVRVGLASAPSSG
jgi:hypothetical protein